MRERQSLDWFIDNLNTDQQTGRVNRFYRDAIIGFLEQDLGRNVAYQVKAEDTDISKAVIDRLVGFYDPSRFLYFEYFDAVEDYGNSLTHQDHRFYGDRAEDDEKREHRDYARVMLGNEDIYLYYSNHDTDDTETWSSAMDERVKRDFAAGLAAVLRKKIETTIARNMDENYDSTVAEIRNHLAKIGDTRTIISRTNFRAVKV